MDAPAAKQLRLVRTLGHGASGAVVWLASDDASGQLLAVKSAGAGGAVQLRREEQVLENLRSPHIVPCLGSRAAAGGGYQLFLEFAPGGSLADRAAQSGGRLAQPAVQAYTRDIARGLAYLHGRSLVHGDVKARNVVIGGDGRARLTDFGCARSVQQPSPSSRPIGGTPAFMAPGVARGEEQGPAADVWAVACTVIEMATGRAPWSDVDDVFAAVRKIGYTDEVPELPAWLPAHAKDFLLMCLARDPRKRPTASQLLEHPFLASASCNGNGNGNADPTKRDWASPNSTLNAAFWESDDEDEETSERAFERISSLASLCSGLPHWDFEEGWIQVWGQCSRVCEAPADTVTAGAGFAVGSGALDAAVVDDLHVVVVEGASRFATCSVRVINNSSKCQQRHSPVHAGGNVGVFSDFVKCHKHPSAGVGNNVGIRDDFAKCKRHPRMSAGRNVGIAADFVKWQTHFRVIVGSNVEYLRPVASRRGEAGELDCPCNRVVEDKFDFVPIWAFS
ncbi:mitogen-activated protein kinase kinase kinase 17-like [Miscanthus floridulus]|uniref:mitogen-activated protein kinase kinase kinase 17-like n=1 Tax=Miscanthus floridulus TaxID=154761 RepID=UPI003457CCDF